MPRGQYSRPSLLDRLLAKTYIGRGCWVWNGSRNRDGYGQISDGPRGSAKNLRVHKIAYQMLVGPIPDGLLICHRCDNPPCWRPSHLYAGTARQNAADALERGQFPTGDRHWTRAKPELLPTGDRHWATRYPERYRRGDQHYSRMNPERLARGDASGARKHPESVPRGEQNGQARLTREIVLDIRHRYAVGGITQAALAEEYGVTQVAISRIVLRKMWNHV